MISIVSTRRISSQAKDEQKAGSLGSRKTSEMKNPVNKSSGHATNFLD